MMDTTADSKMIGTLNFSISFMLYPPSLYAISELGDASGVLKEARQDASMAQMIGSALILFCTQAMMAIGLTLPMPKGRGFSVLPSQPCICKVLYKVPERSVRACPALP